MRNIELKARTTDLNAARLTAQRLATDSLGTQRQIDTYFPCRQGRLKLRQIDGLAAQLVWYVRSDSPRAKASDYQLVQVAEPAKFRAVLAASLGIDVVVEKTREIFLYRNVRIHLDRVTDLGTFVEFEAVLAADESQRAIDDSAGHAQLDYLAGEFGILSKDLVAQSYSDLLRGHRMIMARH